MAELRAAGVHEDGAPIDDAFAVVGVTMCDLYSGDDDLFVAGMAAPSTFSGVLSFARYHPCIEMHPNEWDDVGYTKRANDYPYIETEKKRPELLPAPPKMSPTMAAELLRRAGKLLLHEIGHIFQFAHCIHHNCLMNGTGAWIVPYYILFEIFD